MNKKNPLISRMLHDDSSPSTYRFPFSLVTLNTGLVLLSCPPATACQLLCSGTRAQLMVSDFVLSGGEPMVAGLAGWQAA